MTRTGRIYKIIHNQSNLVYVGSTFNLLRQRWQTHKSGYKRGDGISIYEYFEKYGIENFKMILIKEYQVEDRAHMEAYEQLWINKLKPINKQCAFNLLKKEKEKEYYEKNKEKAKEYYEKNKEEKKEKNKEYREKNKAKIKEKNKEYYEKNKEKAKAINKEYYEKNKAKQKGFCPNCKKEMLKHNINKHIKKSCKKR